MEFPESGLVSAPYGHVLLVKRDKPADGVWEHLC